MPVSTRLIRRRIRSVTNTRKITKAMELVAAAKMRKAVQLTLSSRDYSRTITDVVGELRTKIDAMTHPLLVGRPDARVSLVIVASSDRGLCGGFNSQLLRKTLEFLKKRSEEIRIVTVGKRAELAVKRAGYPIVAAFEAMSNAPSFERSRPVGDLVYGEFVTRRADRVFMVYTDYRSAMTQIPTVAQLLPVIPEADLPKRRTVSMDDDAEGAKSDVQAKVLFEPSARSLLNALLPRLIDTQVYQALLESSASEQAARMMAMRSATDNANGMIEDLTLTFNQARQAGITREISEISAGKAAIE